MLTSRELAARNKKGHTHTLLQQKSTGCAPSMARMELQTHAMRNRLFHRSEGFRSCASSYESPLHAPLSSKLVVISSKIAIV